MVARLRLDGFNYATKATSLLVRQADRGQEPLSRHTANICYVFFRIYDIHPRSDEHCTRPGNATNIRGLPSRQPEDGAYLAAKIEAKKAVYKAKSDRYQGCVRHALPEKGNGQCMV
ncbi:hypothetical protein RB195_002656 [Necator americanus]|uniref:Uncharacterized protein n=1 Tax=Necator americanus TaxID=51031 RepID=A0ABR1DKZ4_NECAM